MSATRATGHPNYVGTFIPEVWSSKLLTKFYAATVLSEISNTDYEGEISGLGDKVKIRQTPDISIRDYTKGSTLTYDRPEAPVVELLIDKAKTFSPIIDDVDKIQSDLNLLDNWTSDAADQMKIAIDRDVLNTIPSSVSADNSGTTAGAISGDIDLGATGSPVQLTKTNIIDKIVDLGTVLDEQNIPETGRWLVLPAWAAGMLKKSDLKDASITGDNESVMRNGRLGMIDRFTLYKSNVLTATTDGGNSVYNILAGHKAGMTFASQLSEVETLRAESTFGTILRGLNVYGYKVTKPDSLARLYAYK